MNRQSLKTIVVGLVLFISLVSSAKDKPRILVFSRTTGYHHSAIPDGIAAIQLLGTQKGFDVDTTTDRDWFRDDVLKKYAALVFLNTTDSARTLLTPEGELALQRYVRAGGGFVGVHAATDAEYTWDWYGKMIGAYFLSHPKQQQATLNIVDSNHPSTKGLPKTWSR